MASPLNATTLPRPTTYGSTNLDSAEVAISLVSPSAAILLASGLLHAVRLLTQMQRRFARGLPLSPEESGADANALFQFTELESLDPILSVLIGYDLLRSGGLNEQSHAMKRIVEALRKAFPGHPDTKAACMAGLPFLPVERPPLLRSGYLALQGALDPSALRIAPHTEEEIDFHEMWTMTQVSTVGSDGTILHRGNR